MNQPDRVLVLGPRQGLLRALKKLDHVEVTVWPKDQPLPRTREKWAEAAPGLAGRFSHVIAGGESAVVPAAYARRALSARAAPMTISLRCHDKLTMKRHLAERGVPMTAFLDAADMRDAQEVMAALKSPVVVKARASSGGRGIRFAKTAQELEEALAGAPRGTMMLERFVDAPEMSVESFVVDGAVRFESFTGYAVKGALNVIPPALDDAVLAQVRALNRQVLRAMHITWGLTHLEVYLTAEGPLLGEVALRPPGGYIMDTMSNAWGFNAWHTFALVELGRAVSFPEARQGFAAGWVLHPGAGQVARIEGEDAVRALPAVKKLKLKVAVGDDVARRVGVGQDVGYAQFFAETRAGLDEALATARETLRITMR